MSVDKKTRRVSVQCPFCRMSVDFAITGSLTNRLPSSSCACTKSAKLEAELRKAAHAAVRAQKVQEAAL